MKKAVIINSLEELRQFSNDEGIIEIAQRGINSKFKTFQNISLENLSKSQNAEQLDKVLKTIKQNLKISKDNKKELSKIASLNQIGIALDAINLCATVAGFSVMYIKLQKMSGQINEVLSTIKTGQDIHAHYEFKKILSTHSDMLDHRKTQRYYNEDKMRELVDGEYNVLCMLVEVFKKGVSEDTETLIYSIVSLASMLSISIRYFDEIYYFNTREKIKNGTIWHSSHDNWIKIYDDFFAKDFVEILQDYTMFNLNLNSYENDLYWKNVLNSFREDKQEIEDNQYLLVKFDNYEMLHDFKKQEGKEFEKLINEAIKENELDDQKELKEYFDSIMNQIGVSI